MSSLALLGDAPRFPGGVPFVAPPVPPLAVVTARLAPSWDAGILTNGPLVRELEEAAAARLGVAHVIAVSSCTAGLMLALRALGPVQRVLLPSFTFSASAHSVTWNSARCVFCECDPSTFQMDVADAAARAAADLAPDESPGAIGAILATHIFGAPCTPEAARRLADSLGVPLVFDAAHAFGARHGGVPVGGFGDVEVFSLTPTKPLVAGEGGLVATNDDAVAHAVRIGRDYGNPGDYDTQFAGLNGRMSEMHAAVALAGLDTFDAHLEERERLARRYRDAIDRIPGLAVQKVESTDRSTWKDFTIAVDAAGFGTTRDGLVAALTAEGVDTRNYFDPPVHRQRSHAFEASAPLPVTDALAASVVSLPIYRSLTDATLDGIVDVLAAVGDRAEAVSTAMAGATG